MESKGDAVLFGGMNGTSSGTCSVSAFVRIKMGETEITTDEKIHRTHSSCAYRRSSLLQSSEVSVVEQKGACLERVLDLVQIHVRQK